MDYSSIMLVAFGVICLLVLLFAVLFGFKRTALQSGIRLVVLVITIVVSAIVTLNVVADAVEQSLTYLETNQADNETIKQLCDYLLGSGVAATDLKEVVVALISPLVFFVMFLLLNLVFLILYSIIGAFTYSQGHAKRKAKRHGEKYKANPFGRILSLVLNVAICFAIASMVLVPVTYYAPLAANAVASVEKAQAEAAAAASESTDENADNTTNAQTQENLDAANDVLSAISDSYLVKVYGVLGDVVSTNITKIELSEGNKVTLAELVESIYPLYSDINGLTGGEITSTKLYSIANTIQDNAFADELVGGLLKDAATKWLNNESFIGIPPISLGSDSLNKSVYKTLSTNDKASEAFRAVGHVYALTAVMNSSSSSSNSNNGTSGDGSSEGQTQSSAEVMKELTSNLTEDSIDIVTELVSGSVIEELGVSGDSEVSENLSTAVSSILTNLYDVQTNGTEEEVEKESAAIAVVLDTATNLSSVTEENANDIISSVKDSNVLQNVLTELVDDGNNTNPFGIEINDETENIIKDKLTENEIDEGSELYGLIMDFFGIGSNGDSEGNGEGEGNGDSGSITIPDNWDGQIPEGYEGELPEGWENLVNP